MVLLWIGIAIGVLIVIVLVRKAIKTPATAVVGMDTYCRKCGLKTDGSRCPRCEKSARTFGV